MDEYHAKKATPDNRYGPVSKSLLWEFNQSPYKWAHKEPFVPTAAMRLGTAAHLMVLEPEKVSDQIRISPFENFRTKEAREWKAEQELTGKIVMSASEGETLDGITVASNLALDDILGPGVKCATEVEVGGCWNDVELCGLIDIVEPSEEMLWDLKTTATIGDERALQRLIFDRGYDVQAAMYADLFAFQKDLDKPPGFGFIFVETSEPFEATWVTLSEESIASGRQRYLPLINRWKQLRDVPLGELPGGVPKGTTIDPPPWAQVA